MNERKLSQIELFAFDEPQCFYNEVGKLGNCRYGILKLTCGEEMGWGECIMSANTKAVDLIKWGAFLRDISKHSLDEAMAIVRRAGSSWQQNQLEVVQMALLDMSARLQGKSLAELVQIQHTLGIAVGAELSTTHNYRKTVKTSSNTWPQKERADTRHIHPVFGSSLIETIRYARQLRNQGFNINIHRDYLIGPARSSLLLLSKTLNAAWSETESESQPIALCGSPSSIYGTGFDLDMPTLVNKSSAYFSVL
ncbi:MAG: hypothetical protein K6T85_06485 [Gorillibacterium sp.]|nr:hypothetical protein [Gorillibacterium sp.]